MNIPTILSLKTTAKVAAVSFLVGACAGYRVTQAFNDADALRREREGLNAMIDARLTAGVNNIAIDVLPRGRPASGGGKR